MKASALSSVFSANHTYTKLDPHSSDTVDQKKSLTKDLKKADLLYRISQCGIYIGGTAAMAGTILTPIALGSAVISTAVVLSTGAAAAAGAVTVGGATVVAVPVVMAIVPIGLVFVTFATAIVGLGILGFSAVATMSSKNNYENYRFINPYDKEKLFKDLINSDPQIKNNRFTHLPHSMRQSYLDFQKTTVDAHNDNTKKIDEMRKELLNKEQKLKKMKDTSPKSLGEKEVLSTSISKLKEEMNKLDSLKFPAEFDGHYSKFLEEFNKEAFKIYENQNLNQEKRLNKTNYLTQLEKTINQSQTLQRAVLLEKVIKAPSTNMNSI